MRSLSSLPLAVLCVVAGCSGSQSALNVHGAPAIHVKHLMTGVVGICALAWLLVMIVLAYALLRSRRPDRQFSSGRRPVIVVSMAVGATAMIIAGLTLASFYTTRAIGRQPDELTITVKGEQWWWRITYPNSDPELAFETANEIHIPVGKNVRLQLESADVIHSFWVPSLAGKQDLVPGRHNSLLIHAERPGIYRGQCAEFCGLQHSHMAMLVVANDDATYQRWLTAQRVKSSTPLSSEALAGRDVFLEKPCAACHSIRGTTAKGSTGPDLTHVGSRQTIAAGLLEATRGSLAAWIADPQTLKPGNNMPMVPLTSDELRQVSRYMESLK